MVDRERTIRGGRALAVAFVVVVSVTTVGVGSAISADAAATTLVVDGEADGDSEYATIQAAVDAAAEGDTVEVNPGTYREEVIVNKTLTLVASRGATITGSSFTGSSFGVRITGNASPVVAGFTITQHNAGINTYNTSGDWVARNVTLVNNSIGGVATGDSEGDWTIRNATIANNGQYGVGAVNSRGDWGIYYSRIEDNAENGISAGNNNADPGTNDGNWEVHYSSITGNGEHGLHAVDAGATGNATRNWWGSENGPDESDCVGNVDCSNHLTSPLERLNEGTGQHESGVSMTVYDAVAGDDGLSRDDVLSMVRDYVTTESTNGVALTRVDIVTLVQYYVTR